MSFSSPQFLFLFLPIFLVCYCVVSLTFPRARNLALVGVSLTFYAYGEGRFVLLLVASSLAAYLFGRLLGAPGTRRGRLAVLTLAVAMNLLGLAALKYSPFLLGSLGSLFPEVNPEALQIPLLHLPMGISFFTFRAISYIIDVYRGRIATERNVVDLVLYITLFPQLIAGPIARFGDVAKELHGRRADISWIASGVQRFCIGLAKKVLIADIIAQVADRTFTLDPATLPCGVAWLGAIAYTLQIYYDFSGYSDMAIGLGKMLGFTLPENFAHPYASASIREFWRRWHMTLTSWFRDYVYIPLGGNRHGIVRTCVNLLAVFVLCGLWHGASWTFVIWGLYHGFFLVVERLLPGSGGNAVRYALSHLYALLVVIVGWVIFRSDTITLGLEYLGAMFGANHVAAAGASLGLRALLDSQLVTALGVGAVLSFPWESHSWNLLRQWRARIWLGSRQMLILGRVLQRLAPLLLLAASAVQIAAGTYVPFIYFGF